ncbi:hypothetical protein RF11_09639 [Thelohanellus kitauei]|uniref:Uncharacterized protein n=1 Tax=Thelohanellus kitauei TaxID=669202 RepID=A0A0C2N2A2_THEKT|nr:hypothetical protein RF11_09639 [Thelohanellus kitauei]
MEKYFNTPEFIATISCLVKSEINLDRLVYFKALEPAINELACEDLLNVISAFVEKFIQQTSMIKNINDFDVILRSLNRSLELLSKTYKNEVASQLTLENQRVGGYFAILIHSYDPSGLSDLPSFAEKCIQLFKISRREFSQEALGPFVNFMLFYIKKFYTNDEQCLNQVFELLTKCYEHIHRFGVMAPCAQPLLVVCAMMSDSLDPQKFSTHVSSFIRQAIVLLEERIPSTYQLKCLEGVVFCLYHVLSLSSDEFRMFCSNLEKVVRNFISSTNQLAGLLHITNLYWLGDAKPERQSNVQDDPVSVLRCLSESVSIIGLSIGNSHKLKLHIQLLQKCLYFIREKCQTVTPQFIDTVFTDADKVLASIEDHDQNRGIIDHYNRIRRFYYSTQTENESCLS